MKIYFYVAQKQNTSFIPAYTYTKATTLKEANAIVKGAIDKSTYALLKAFEKNKDFVEDIQFLRKKYGIPAEGFSLKEWDAVKLVDPVYKGFGVQSAALLLLAGKYNIPFYLRRSLKYIVVGGFVYLPLSKVEIEMPLVPDSFENSVHFEPEVMIRIQGNISKNYLINFVKDHWDEIEDGLRLFSDEKDIYISERDREILRLRDDKKLKFTEIADLLAEETGDFDINEDY